jgi:hypothetical protein
MNNLGIRTGLRAGALTVYGTEWCSWTKKQRDYLTNKGIPFTFVNCEEGKCPAGVNAYPTLDQDGVMTVGYREI